ncbi:MAG: VanZ family protein [Lachnospiraceae bacterium]|nr:VanZ family protein [Lachnospiraceae bacterium]
MKETKNNLKNEPAGRRKIILRAVAAAAVIAWMAVIFLLSAEEGEKSSHTSDIIVDAVVSVAEGVRLMEPEDATPEFRERLSFVVRKCGHAAEYAILAVLTALALLAWGVRRAGMLALIAWVWSVVYAATDEYHQLSVAGRAGQWRDVLIDAAGAAAGVIAFVLVLLIIRKHSGKRARNA